MSTSSVPEDRGVYMESYTGYLNFGWSPLAGWVDQRGKYLHSSKPELYDLDADPLELESLVDRKLRFNYVGEERWGSIRGRVQRTRRANVEIHERLLAADEEAGSGDPSAELSAEDRAALEQLGYFGTSAGPIGD